MKKVKLLLLAIILILSCTGCTVEYNINISKNEVKEIINVNDYIYPSRTKEDIISHYNMWYPTYVNFKEEWGTIEITDFKDKYQNIEYHDKKIGEIDNGYNYTYTYNYPIDKYYDSYVLATAFTTTKVYNGGKNLVLKTDKTNLLCNYDYFESAKVNITIDPAVYKLNYTNATSSNNNTYTWILDRTNCNNSEIILTLDTISSNSTIEDIINSMNGTNKDNDDTNKDNNSNTSSDYTLYIFCGILLILILIGNFIFKIIKKKQEKFDIDD